MADSATFDELMRAAVNAHKSGDATAARQLVQMAKSIGQPATARDTSLDSAGTGNLTPTAYDPSERVATYEADSFGPTIQAATEQPLEATRAFYRGLKDQAQSPTMQALPDWIPDRAKPTIAAAGDTAGTALGALGTAYGFGAGLVGEMVGGNPTQEKKLARDLMMAGQVAVPELAGSSGALLAAQKAGSAVKRIEATPSNTQRAARAADDLGITPSLGAGGKGRAMTAATLEKVPGSGSAIAKDAERFVGEVEAAFQNITSKVGRAGSAPEAGQKLQRGLEGFVTDFKRRSGEMFSEVGNNIPDGTLIQAPETVRAIQDAIEPFSQNPAIATRLGLDKWAGVAGDLENGVTWRAASDLRTSIGESIGKINGPLADMDQGKLKMAYAKLTEDLEAAAKAAGPQAEQAWRRANQYYRRGAERIEGALDKTISASSPERAFEALVGMAKGGRASADSKRLWRIRSSMPKDEWRDVSASIIDRLGRAPAGSQNAAGDAFSPARFLTEWNNLSDEAKSILLPQNLRSEMNKLAEVAELTKAANAERNFSNTGNVVVGAGTGAAMTQAPLTTGALLSASWVSSKALTNPATLRALNKMARGDATAMRRLAKGNGPVAEEARTILRMTAAESAATGNAANANGFPPVALP